MQSNKLVDFLFHFCPKKGSKTVVLFIFHSLLISLLVTTFNYFKDIILAIFITSLGTRFKFWICLFLFISFFLYSFLPSHSIHFYVCVFRFVLLFFYSNLINNLFVFLFLQFFSRF